MVSVEENKELPSMALVVWSELRQHLRERRFVHTLRATNDVNMRKTIKSYNACNSLENKNDSQAAAEMHMSRCYCELKLFNTATCIQPRGNTLSLAGVPAHHRHGQVSTGSGARRARPAVRAVLLEERALELVHHLRRHAADLAASGPFP